LTKAAKWYNKKKAGLGTDLVERVQTVLESIVEPPDRFAIVFKDVREAPVARFPYCVYYRIRSNRIVIFQTARDPARWQRRV
jgi:toxin ParE1/3/4